MSNSNKKIKFFTISLLCILFILSIATILSTIKVSAETTEINTIEFSKYTPTINDDFADNKVIVTLKPEYSDVNKNMYVVNENDIYDPEFYWSYQDPFD